MTNIYAIRGATTVVADCREQIEERTKELLCKILRENRLYDGAKCISLQISTTKDIRSFYPARAVRESGMIDVPLFSCGEPDIEGALPLCIRMLLTVATETPSAKAHHVYLHGAATLRPDLAQNPKGV